VTSQLKKLTESNPTVDMVQANPNRYAQKQLQHARKGLIEECINAYNNRQVFLDHLQEKRIESGDTARAHIINQIEKSEKCKQCWRTLKLLRQGPQSSGGISHVLIPSSSNDGNLLYQRIQSKDELDRVLLPRNILHFKQAQGTPLTGTTLTEYVGDDGL
jgi:hypothetical protein